MFKPYFKEVPRTKFTSLYKPKISVECPNKNEMIPRLKKVIGATWAEDIAEAMTIGDPKKLFEGTALWQGLEYLQFFITIENVSRIFTHQLVRMRIGTTYSQQCSGDADWRHHDVLVPPSITKLGSTGLQRYIDHMLLVKQDYCKLIDGGLVSLQEARYLLPHNLSTFIIMNTNLAALAPFIRKRMCAQTQCWEMIVVAKTIRQQIIEKWPELMPTMPDDCASGSCFWAMSVKKGDPDAHTNLYRVGLEHPKAPMFDIPSVYPIKHRSMVSGKEIEDLYYLGDEKVEPWDTE